MADNVSTTIESLFKGMDGIISTKTVVGDPITVGDTIIVPLVDVSFGIGAGNFSGDKKAKGAGGMGGKVEPTAVLVIKDGHTKMMTVKNQDVATKIVDLIPDLVDKITSKKNEPEVDLDKVLDQAAEEKQN